MTNYNYKNAKGGQMMINRLYSIERVAKGLREQINPQDQFPLWTQNKIATAQDRLTSAMQYLVSKKQQFNNQQMGNLGFFTQRSETEKAFRNIGSGLGLIGAYYLLQDKKFKSLRWWQKIGIYTAVTGVGRETFGFIGKKID